MSLKSDSRSNGPNNEHPTDVHDNDNDDDNNIEQYGPFNPSQYPGGANGSMYMSPSSTPPMTRTHDHRHQK